LLRVLFLLLLPSVTFASTVVVDRVDVIEVDALERREFEIDSVESAIVAGRPLPAAFATVEAGEDGWFLDERLTGNYARATVSVAEAGVYALLGMAYTAVYVNGALRIGNVYGWKDTWESWEPNFDFSWVPVHLEAGENELLFFGIRWGRMKASLHRAERPLRLNPHDVTRPDLVVGEPIDTVAAIPVLNLTQETIDDARIWAIGPSGVASRFDVPPLPPLSVRKAAVPIVHPPIDETGPAAFSFRVTRGDRPVDRPFDNERVDLDVKEPHENRRVTFVSEIDGSVQYYGLLPSSGGPGPKALVLSLHGAAVEAINQSGSYAALDWAHIVAPTNRRPFGFDWENWGRLDAFEVLEQATSTLDIDESRIYLTGHSMGGHGTWHLATLHPDRFAAAGPSAGWISYWSYRRNPPADDSTPLKDMLRRGTLTSRTLQKAPNLAPLGLYVLHGAADDNVPPEQSHLMLERLEGFHRNFVYHEQPDVGHWWDLDDTPGADCVAWAPMFDFFARHRRPAPSEVRDIDFLTPNPAVSAWNHWAGILRQQRVFEMSGVDLRLDPWRARVRGTTSNVEVLAFDLSFLDVDSVRFDLDGEVVTASVPPEGPIHLERGATWTQIDRPDPAKRGAHRNGGFRDAFTNRPQLVVGTRGSADDTARGLGQGPLRRGVPVVPGQRRPRRHRRRRLRPPRPRPIATSCSTATPTRTRTGTRSSTTRSTCATVGCAWARGPSRGRP
jgi:dienelactone hydrolase